MTLPDHEGAVGKQGQGLLARIEKMLLPSWTQKERTASLLDLLVCCRAVSKSALISRESRQQGSGPAQGAKTLLRAS